MTWHAVSTDLFPNGVQDLEHAIVQNQVWAIISSMSFLGCCLLRSYNGSPATPVNANATERLNAAVVAADGSYTSNGTITTYVAEARNENA
jgi:hypothetical protein